MTKLELNERGSANCRIHFKPYNDIIMQAVLFRVDTGVDFTSLSKKQIYDLGYSKEWLEENKKPRQTATLASGEKIHTYYIQMPMVNLYGFEAVNWPFVIAADDEKDFAHLLGLDLLAGFNFTFDNDNNCFMLARAKSYKQRYDFFPGQAVMNIE